MPRLYTEPELYEALRELDVIPEAKLSEAFKASRKQKISLEDFLIDKDLVSDANLGKVIADLSSYRFINLPEVAIDKAVLDLIPEVYAHARGVVAFKKDKIGLHIAMHDPGNKEIPDFVSKKTGVPVVTYYATKRGLRDGLNNYSKNISDVFDKLISESVKKAGATKESEPSIIAIVDTIVSYAYKNKASDIHIEPTDTDSDVRFRVDGVLHDIVKIPKNIHSQIVTRVKVMARLRTDEHQAAQDGKIVVSLEEEEVDIRVSIVPTVSGEKIVMRLLSERSRQFSLTDLGFSEGDLKKIEGAYKKPHGMILATGPTGSGKTTTLYAILKLINNRDVNVMTIEDPVEYDIEGVNQIQVNPATNLNFAAGLKSIVRQDPDIILVGEIRDQETADISINAAMTGHLVLSTLHTNDAATTFPRLIDLGVEPYLIASTINVVIAQRLVRKICIKCRFSQDLNLESTQPAEGNSEFASTQAEFIKKFAKGQKNIRIYRGKGCDVCHQTGYMGREGIFEVMVINDEIRSAIVAKQNASELKKIAIATGMRTMTESGIEKVLAGLTTLDEIVRVTKE